MWDGFLVLRWGAAVTRGIFCSAGFEYGVRYGCKREINGISQGIHRRYGGYLVKQTRWQLCRASRVCSSADIPSAYYKRFPIFKRTQRYTISKEKSCCFSAQRSGEDGSIAWNWRRCWRWTAPSRAWRWKSLESLILNLRQACQTLGASKRGRTRTLLQVTCIDRPDRRETQDEEIRKRKVCRWLWKCSGSVWATYRKRTLTDMGQPQSLSCSCTVQYQTLLKWRKTLGTGQ